MRRSLHVQVAGTLILIVILQIGSKGLAIVAQSLRPATEPKQPQTLDCSSEIQTFPVPFASDEEAAGDENRPTIRAGFVLNSALSLNVTEHALTDLSGYGTEVVVKHKGGREDHFQIWKLIGNSDLRLVHAAEVCSGPTDRTLVLEYEGNPTGGIEGFALIRYSSSGDSVEVYTLPITQQGKIVVFKNIPDYVQVWTTVPGGSITSEVSERRYRIRSCTLQKGRFMCGTKGHVVGLYSPGEIDDPGIEIK